MTTPVAIDFKARAQKGFDFLQRQRPGWLHAVDLPSLELSDCRFCVLGQLMGDYEDGIVSLALDYHTTAVDHGFSLTGSEVLELRKIYGNDSAEIYAPLTEAWRELIIAARAEQT